MSILSHTWTLLFIFGVYYVCYLAMNWSTRNRAILALPFYTLISTLILVPLGAWSYLRMATAHKNYGVIRPGLKQPRQRRSELVFAEMVAAVSAQDLSVADLQFDLAAVGHDPGPIDGVFGLRTKRAVIEWQQYLVSQGHDLGASGADGVFGPRTALASRAEAPWLGLADRRLSTDDWMERFRRPLFRSRGRGVDPRVLDRPSLESLVD
jgi:hypothetical protein